MSRVRSTKLKVWYEQNKTHHTGVNYVRVAVQAIVCNLFRLLIVQKIYHPDRTNKLRIFFFFMWLYGNLIATALGKSRYCSARFRSV